MIRDVDPRDWVVSVAYAVVVNGDPGDVVAGDDAADARWWPVAELPGLAFDHGEIVARALKVAGIE